MRVRCDLNHRRCSHAQAAHVQVTAEVFYESRRLQFSVSNIFGLITISELSCSFSNDMNIVLGDCGGNGVGNIE